MAKTALLLGGGGTVGIAWENGVLAGLGDAAGFDSTSCVVIVGTSAGSAVGADMALGKDPHDALAHDAAIAAITPRYDPPSLESGPFAEIIALMMAPDSGTPERVAQIGELAISAPSVIDPQGFLDRFARSVGTDEWPSTEFRPTAACCETGDPVVWRAADGIPLSHAVASSCAIPGFFPPVEHGGRHYMDGSRGRDYHARIVAEYDVDTAIYIGPRIPVPGVIRMIEQDMVVIADAGIAVHTIIGSERLDGAEMNLMDTSRRPEAFEIGLRDGADAAAAIGRLIG